MRARQRISLRGSKFRRAEVQGGLTPDRVKAWRSLFDPNQVEIEGFLGRFKTRTKDTDPDTGAILFKPFILFDFQMDLLDRTRHAWKKGRAAKWRNPKSRQLGVSQFWRAFLGFERVLRVPGYETVIIGQDQTASEEHLSYLTEFYQQIPDGVLPALGIRQLKSSASTLAFRHGDYRTSRVTVKTARRKGLGRGGQMNGCHTTEFPHWPDLSKRDRSSFLESLADVSGNVHADESTVMGQDEYYEDCMDARDGRGSYMLMFIPSHVSDRNYREFTSPEARENFVATLGKDERYGGIEEFAVQGRVERFWRKERGADGELASLRALEFVHWRRYKIDDDCKRVSVFHREQPTTLDEAFQGSGHQVFDPDIMNSWVESARRMDEGGENGTMMIREGRVLFVPRRDGALRVFSRPVSGMSYVFGADPASGHRVIASGGGEADFSTIVVKEALTGRTVARFKDHIFPKQFSDLILKVAAYYNGAQGYVEINKPTTVAFMLEEEGEVQGYVGEDVLLTSERKVQTSDGWQKQPQYGWNTSEKTKNYMAGVVNKFLAEIGQNVSGERDAFHDEWTLKEMILYVYDERGRMSAERGHDDLVIAEGLALVARDEILGNEDFSSKVEYEDDPWAVHFRQVAAERNSRRAPVEIDIPHPTRKGERLKMPNPAARGGGATSMPGF